MNEINLKVNMSYGDTSINDDTSDETTLVLFIFWGIFLPLIALVGLVGNILTIIVLWRREMHSTTILYLRGLVITDTGILIGTVITLTPISCANYLHGDLDFFKDRVYPIFYAPGYYLIMALQQANVWITVSVSMERYIAICHPFRAARLITRRKTILVMVVIALVSLVYNIPHLLATQAAECKTNVAAAAVADAAESLKNTARNVSAVSLAPTTGLGDVTMNDVLLASVNSSKSSSTPSGFSSPAILSDLSSQLEASTMSSVHPVPHKCLEVSTTAFGNTEFYKFYRTIMYTVVIYVIPFLALVILNSFLIKELMTMQRRRSGTNIHDENEANLSLVLVLIVIVFILCQTPGLISQFDVISIRVFFIWLAVSNVLFTTNSAVNFLIYTAFGRKFRSVLLRLFRRFYHGSRKQSLCSYRNTQLTTDLDASHVLDTGYSSMKSNKSQGIGPGGKSAMGGGGVGGSGGVNGGGGKNGMHEHLQLNNLSRSNNNDNNGVVCNGVNQGGSLKKQGLSPTPEVEEDQEDDRINEKSPLTWSEGQEKVQDGQDSYSEDLARAAVVALSSNGGCDIADTSCERTNLRDNIRDTYDSVANDSWALQNR